MEFYCKDCGLPFKFSEEEQKYFKKKGWGRPIRCPVCRKRRKAQREDPYFGFEQTMYSGFSRKHRHTRVHYPPHIVGGFR